MFFFTFRKCVILQGDLQLTLLRIRRRHQGAAPVGRRQIQIDKWVYFTFLRIDRSAREFVNFSGDLIKFAKKRKLLTVADNFLRRWSLLDLLALLESLWNLKKNLLKISRNPKKYFEIFTSNLKMLLATVCFNYFIKRRSTPCIFTIFKKKSSLKECLFLCLLKKSWIYRT